MSSKTKIEWTESTWNPLRGCTRISPGCMNCYAERLAATRLSAPGQPYHGLAKITENGPRWTNKILLVEEQLEIPLHWKSPRMIFVNSMSDLFHEDVPLEFIQKVFNVMRRASWHTFQLLTKRSQRLLELDQYLNWPNNVWMGVSVESKNYEFRIEHLRQTHAKIKFLSIEPLLEELNVLNLNTIDWVVVGGESGPNARPIKESWVLSIQKDCQRQNTAFFFKQWGGINKKQSGRLLQGKTWDEMPHDRKQEYNISKNLNISEKRRLVFRQAYQYFHKWTIQQWTTVTDQIEDCLTKKDIWAECLKMAWKNIKNSITNIVEQIKVISASTNAEFAF